MVKASRGAAATRRRRATPVGATASPDGQHEQHGVGADERHRDRRHDRRRGTSASSTSSARAPDARPPVAGGEHWNGRPSIVARAPRLAEQVEHRRGHVGQLHVAVAPGGRRPQQPAVDPGRRQGDGRARAARCGGDTGDEDEHGVAVGGRPARAAAEQVVGVGEQRRPIAAAWSGASSAGGRRRPAQVRGLDERRPTGARPPRRPPRSKASSDLVGVEPHAERRRSGSSTSRSADDRARGHDAVRAHQHGRGLAVRRRRRAAGPRTAEARRRVGVGHDARWTPASASWSPSMPDVGAVTVRPR